MNPPDARPLAAAPPARPPTAGHPAGPTAPAAAVGSPTDVPRGGLAEAIGRRLPGLAVVSALAAAATVLGHLVPVIGAPVFAIVGGIAIAALRTPPDVLRPGLGFASRTVLQGSIVVLGTGLSLHQVLTTGARSLPVLAGTLVVALGGAALAGRWLGIERDVRTLIGVGTGICGASAIAATDAVISAAEADVAYAIATIFTFNVAAVLTFPTIGHLLGLSSHAFGLWAGTAVNDMSSVVAAATVFGHGATSSAVVVKLTRTLAIIPITITLALWRSRRAARLAARAHTEGGPGAAVLAADRPGLAHHVRRAFPLFIVWFLVAVVANTAGLVPAGWHGALGTLAQVAITVALGAIGLSTRLRDIRRAGLRPLALGAVLWVLVATTSLGLQAATGGLGRP